MFAMWLGVRPQGREWVALDSQSLGFEAKPPKNPILNSGALQAP